LPLWYLQALLDHTQYFEITGLLPLMLCTAEMTYEHARLCIAINFEIEYWLLPKLAKGIIIVKLFELNITAETYTKYNNIYYCELFIISENLI
jgi:hypothetical protein